MDKYVIDYLNSGEAFLFIGSGPSIQMGYPTWYELARNASRVVKNEVPHFNESRINHLMEKAKYPDVFEMAVAELGFSRILEELETLFEIPRNNSKIYELITRWPVSVFLTTNYDMEIQKHLSKLNEAFTEYSNSEDHFAYLNADCKNAIFKLHGDLRSKKGLILTKKQYNEILHELESTEF